MNPVETGERSKYWQAIGMCFCLLSLFLLPVSGAVAAGPEVSAVYQQDAGTQLVVAIRIGAPPPSSLILVQTLPPGVGIRDASPPANNVNQGKGEAKWLLRNIAQGEITIRMTLDRPVAASEISAEVRFMPARGGGMQTVPVARR